MDLLLFPFHIWLLLLSTSLSSGCVFRPHKVLTREEQNEKDRIKGKEDEAYTIDKSISRTSSKSNPECQCGIELRPFPDKKPLERPWIVYIHVRVGKSGDMEQFKTCTGTIINSNMIVTSHKCLMKNGKLNIADVWNNKGFLSSTLAAPKDIIVNNHATLNHEGPKVETELPPLTTFTVTKIIYKESTVFDLLKKKPFSESDVVVIMVKEDLNNMEINGIRAICLPRKGLYPTGHLVNLVGQYQGVRGWIDQKEKYRIGLHSNSKILRGPSCNKWGKLNLTNVNEETLCLKFYQNAPNIEGGPLRMKHDQYISGNIAPERSFLIGIANWVQKEYTGAGHSYAFFTNVNTIVTYLEKLAVSYKSEWCALPVPDLPDEIWPWEHYKPKKLDPKELLNCDCGLSPTALPKGRIVGGEEAIPHEFPWMVSMGLYYQVPGTGQKSPPERCGGAIINDRVILTAAHCFVKDHRIAQQKSNDFNLIEYPFQLKKHDIVINSHYYATLVRAAKKRPDLDDKYKEGQVLRATQIYFHPGYAMELKAHIIRRDFDIALIILQDPIDLTALDPENPSKKTPIISPLCLPKIGEVAKYFGKIATVAGWGTTDEADKSPNSLPLSLRKVDLPIHPIHECTKVSHFYNKDNEYPTDTMMCAGYPPKYNYMDAGAGDSGGPIFIQDKNGKYIQLGLVSHAPKLNATEKTDTVEKFESAGYYTKVESFLPYIYYYSDFFNAKWCRPLK